MARIVADLHRTREDDKTKVATRNVADFQGMGLKLIDPWAYTL